MAKALLKGTKTRTAEQIADTIEAVGGSIGSDAGNNSFSVSLDVTQPDLKLGVGIARRRLAQRDDAGKSNRARKGSAARRNQGGRRAAHDGGAQYFARRRSSASIPMHFAARAPPSRSRADQEGLIDFRDRYLVAKNGVISVFGNVKAAEVKQIFEQPSAE